MVRDNESCFNGLETKRADKNKNLNEILFIAAASNEPGDPQAKGV